MDDTKRRGLRQLVTVLMSVGRWAILVLGVLLAYIGLLSLVRGTAVRHVRGAGADGVAVAPDEPEFPLTVAMLTGTRLTPGNHVEIGLNGDGTFPRLWDDLRSARKSITLQMYYGQPGRVADELRAILLDRAAAGVAVHVLYDAFGTADIAPDHLAAYRAAGVIVVPFRPLRLSTLHLFQNRSHVRGVVIDSRIGWTGGFGIDDKWLGDGSTNGAWRETNVRFEGPAVTQLQAAFAIAWVEATGVMLSGRATLPVAEQGTATAGLLYASPTLGSTAAERFFALSIAGARKRIYLTNAYFSPDRYFIDGLIAAARRGVDVRVITGGGSSDVQTARLAGRATYDALLRAGVRIYEWEPTVMHAKTFVIDGVWSTIGTINFDNRSLALNEEATLMILDPDVGHQLETIFLDDMAHAVPITLEHFSRRSWIQRLAEKSTFFVRRLL